MSTCWTCSFAEKTNKHTKKTCAYKIPQKNNPNDVQYMCSQQLKKHNKQLFLHKSLSNEETCLDNLSFAVKEVKISQGSILHNVYTHLPGWTVFYLLSVHLVS